MKKIVKQAFTLIELLVVIAIIGILSGLIVVAMGGVTTKATIAKAQIFSNSLKNSLMLNLIAEYKLDGNVEDTWGGHAAGSTSTISVISSCVQQSCYSFDGANSYLGLNDASDLRLINGGTISVWIYPKSDGEGPAGRIIDKSSDASGLNGYVFGLANTRRIQFKINGNGIETSDNTTTWNKWQLVTITFNGSVRTIYIDGVQVDSDAFAYLPPDNSVGIRIGNRSGGLDYTFNGYIDELRIYNVVISTSQIKEQYYTGLNNLLINGGINEEEYISRINTLAIK